MAKLDKEARDNIPTQEFLGPGRTFPANDRTHTKLAISGATRSEHAGNISASTAESIKAKARRLLGDTKGVVPGTTLARRQPGGGARKILRFGKGKKT
jgi:hypothetical protein